MSDYAFIAIKNEDGTIRSSRWTYGGYYSCFQILKNTYQTIEQINELIDLGDISVLGETVAETKVYAKPSEPEWGYCKYETFNSIEEWLEWNKNLSPEHYLFYEGEWHYIEWDKRQC